MSQFSTGQVRRRGGDLSVYTVLLVVATIVLAAGVAILWTTNTQHSAVNGSGGAFQLVE